MDIEEIKAKREELRTKLVELVEKFERETGACVKEVDIKHEGKGFVLTRDCTNPVIVYMTVEI